MVGGKRGGVRGGGEKRGGVRDGGEKGGRGERWWGKMGAG